MLERGLELRWGREGRAAQAASWLVCLLLAALLRMALAAPLADPEVDRYPVRVGTQTFSPLYSFTPTNSLVETALAMLTMESDTIKFCMGSGAQGQYGITFPGGVNSLETEARLEPNCRTVFSLPFRHYVIWTYCFAQSGTSWTDGFSTTEQQKEYSEIYAFSRYLLTNFNNSGKSFYLGHWEGDWYLLPGYDPSTNPSPVRVQGMRDWLNTRQLAVDDAMRTVPHSNVNVFAYTEVNRVRDAMVNGPTNNQRLVNTVLPYVTNLDYVSWSSYDGQNLGTTDLLATLDYIQSNLSSNKTATISGRRVFIGEYGWGQAQTSLEQEPLTRAYQQRLFRWGPPFILFWEMYNNEVGNRFWLIDDTNTRTPCYYLHQNFANEARLAVARFKERYGRVPSHAEFEGLMIPVFGAPLIRPPALSVLNAGPIAQESNSATVAAVLRQNFYGDDQAAVRVFWGPQDGGAVRANWANQQLLGLNTNFNAAVFTGALATLGPGTNYFRAYATNAAGEFWSPSSSAIVPTVLDTNAYGYRLRFTFSGYNLREPLVNFPVLLHLSTNIPGFSYRQFASTTGGDLRFAAADGRVPLLHEIDEWNPSGTSLIWVRVPLLTSTNDSLQAFWGNPSAAIPPATSTNGGVWSGDHELVWHMKDTALPFVDAAGLHPAGGVQPVSTVAGLIGRGAVFDGSSQYLDAGVVNLGGRFTVSAWIKVAATANNIQTLWANKAGGYTSSGFGLFVNSYQTADQKLAFEAGDGVNGSRTTTDSAAVASNQWQHVAVAVDRANSGARLYVNGIELTGAATINNAFPVSADLLLGRFTNAAFGFHGTIDEARVAKSYLSAAWLRAGWLNVVSNNFFAVSSPVAPNLPSLAATISAGNAVISWPGSAVGYSLYSCTNLASPVLWEPVSSRPTLVNGRWQLTLPLSPAARFYRLQ